MQIFNYLQLQPVDPQDDGTTSDLDEYDHDETIDLSGDADGEELAREWEEIEKDLHASIHEDTTSN